MAKLAEIKTKETDSSAEEFINSIKEEQKRKDSLTLLKLFRKVTKEKPRMWGSSIVGFGNKIYKSPTSGRQVEWFKVGFSPRKGNISLYLVIDLKRMAPALQKLGKHKAGVGCLYIKKLDDIDIKILEKMIVDALKVK